LSLSHGSQTYTTASISRSATAAQVQSALNAALATLSVSGVAASAVVDFWNGGELRVTFGGGLAGVDVAQLTGSAAATVEPAGLAQTAVGFSRAAVPATTTTTVVDYARQSLAVPTGPSTSYTLTMDGALGEVTRASGTLTVTAGAVIEVTGGWAFTKTNKDGVERLEAGVAGATAFVGNNRGQANESGVKVTGANLGLVMVERTAPATAKYALSGSGAVSLVGVTGLQLSGTASVQVNRMDAAVNESITTPGGAVAVVFPSAVAVTRVSGTLDLATPLATLSGAFAIEATGAAPQRELLIGATDVSALVGDAGGAGTADDVGVALREGTLTAYIAPSGVYAFDASAAAGLVGVDGVTLSGTVNVQKNTTGAAVNRSITVNGQTRTLALAGQAHPLRHDHPERARFRGSCCARLETETQDQPRSPQHAALRAHRGGRARARHWIAVAQAHREVQVLAQEPARALRRPPAQAFQNRDSPGSCAQHQRPAGLPARYAQHHSRRRAANEVLAR